ncbi:hypothetical protein FA15DRAFT_744146 [Coprinopsis marcescibilis]|uniref:Concanavalin A-like lectin/glucanase n=1 Tax=Coprinopsis marcescibilis TaxID=230819 RepID=A0A5C3KT22_COPMA|nr:hypothetical protein FA15DRAFT_744146 [Coprinopsis marcescibilis]
MVSSNCWIWRFLVAVTCLQATCVYALRNVTVDDSDASITWVGNWTRAPVGFGQPFGGTYMTTREPTAYAEFKFTGVGVYFISPRWPSLVTVRLTLDPSSPDSRPLPVNLEDYQTPSVSKEFGQALVLASATGLNNVEHTVRLNMGVTGGDEASSEIPYAVYDAFIYTIVEAGDSILTNTPSSPAPAFTALPEAQIVSDSSASPSPTSHPGPFSGPSSASNSEKGGLTVAQISIVVVSVFLFLSFIIIALVAWRFKLVKRDLLRGLDPEASSDSGSQEKRKVVSEDITAKMVRAMQENGESVLSLPVEQPTSMVGKMEGERGRDTHATQ